jgi:hypothetical protein
VGKRVSPGDDADVMGRGSLRLAAPLGPTGSEVRLFEPGSIHRPKGRCFHLASLKRGGRLGSTQVGKAWVRHSPAKVLLAAMQSYPGYRS